MSSLQEELLLLEEEQGQGINQNKNTLYTGDGSVDINGNPVLKHNTGNWRACYFILGTECSERLAYYGIAYNLVSYLTKRLHQGNASAAKSVTTWQGTSFLTPLIGATLADSYWGRYHTVAVFSTVYFIGMCILTLSASVPVLKPVECVGSMCPEATPVQYAVFFFGLYLIAVGAGGIKPCVSSFGADQFDDTDPDERVKKGSFFNWFYLSINIGCLVSSSVLVWIQENAGWGIGYGIPALCMCIAIGCFLFGTSRYRFRNPVGSSPVTRMFQVLVAAFRKRSLNVPSDSDLLYETESSVIKGYTKIPHSFGLSYLDKAAVISDTELKTEDFSNPWSLCTVTEVEELKILIRMFPIWITGIFFQTIHAQMSSLFVEQGMMMNTSLGSFTLPPASLSTFDIIGVIILVPVYDKLIVPTARKFTNQEQGFSQLQRMGIGLFLSIFTISAAALLETYRLHLAGELGLIDKHVPVPLSILWQIPQFLLMGVSEVFINIGQVEFFYDQSPDSMRSLSSAFALVVTSLGSYLSSLIVTVVTCFTSQEGQAGWIPDNLNEGHLDYFFWVLAVIGCFNLVVYIFFARKYQPKKVI